MSDFRRLTENVLVSPQLALGDIAEAAALGVTKIVNNRPDGEDPDAPQGDEIADAAAAAGLNYVAIPIGHAGFSEPQVDAMIQALDQAEGAISPIAAPAPAPRCCGRWRAPSRAWTPKPSPAPQARRATMSARFAA